MTLRLSAPFVAALLAVAVVAATAAPASSTPATPAPQSSSTSLRPARLKPSLDVKHGNQSNNHKNISQLLDDLLRGYDNSVRPNLGGPPAVVEVDIMVRSMGPVSEVDMTYSMDCYFRQSWVDRRLAFKSSTESLTLALSISMLQRIWKPDTFFYNGKQSYLHTITTPNKFVRLYQDGRVLYSSRLTIKAGCPMHLENFPMDTQKCPLTFGSFGYSMRDVLYRWNTARQVAIADDMKLSQFDLIATPAGNRTDNLKSGNHSMLLVSFHLRRHMGNFLIQVYGPCVLLVVLSWVSFWLNREATADRVSLGITTVLTMTFLGLEARTDLPKVAYPTALDFFVFLSFAFIFATIIQFAVVHYFTKYGSGECYFGFYSDSCSEEEDDEAAVFPTGVIPLHAGTLPPPPRPPATVGSDCLGRSRRPRYPVGAAAAAAAAAAAIRRRGASAAVAAVAAAGCAAAQPRAPRFNSVSQIDRASRVVFPLCFVSINVAYWGLYLSRSQRVG